MPHLGFLGNSIGVLDLYSKYDVPKRNSSSRSSYVFIKKSNADATGMSTHSTNSADRNQISNDRKKARPASAMGFRVQAYSQFIVNFRLSTIPGAPSPFKARFITVSKETAPVIMTRTKPITDGTGSTKPTQS